MPPMQWLGFVDEDNTQGQQMSLERDKMAMGAMGQQQNLRLQTEQVDLAKKSLDHEIDKYLHEIGREDLKDKMQMATMGVSLMQIGQTKTGAMFLEQAASALGMTPGKLSETLLSQDTAKGRLRLAAAAQVAKMDKAGKQLMPAEVEQYLVSMLSEDVAKFSEPEISKFAEEAVEHYQKDVSSQLAQESRAAAEQARKEAAATHAAKLPGLEIARDLDIELQAAMKTGDPAKIDELIERKAKLNAASNPFIAGQLVTAKEEAKAPFEEKADKLANALKGYTNSWNDPELRVMGIRGPTDERVPEATELEKHLQTAFISSDESTKPADRDKAVKAALKLIGSISDPQLKNKLSLIYNQARDYRAIVIGASK